MEEEVYRAFPLFLVLDPNFAWKKTCAFGLPKRRASLSGGEDFIVLNGEGETNYPINCQLRVGHINL